MTPEEWAKGALSDWELKNKVAPWVLEDLWSRIERVVSAAAAEERKACAQLMRDRERQYLDHLFSGPCSMPNKQCLECERLAAHATAILARENA